MSKKFIALVLFAAMLVSLIPVASAQTTIPATGWTGVYPQVAFPTAGWYVGQNVETVSSIERDKEFTIGVREDGYGNEIGGVKVTIKSADKNDDGDIIGTTIKVTGSYEELQPYYYSWMAQSGDMGVALKIPVRILIGDNAISQSAVISGAQGYVNTYPGLGADYAYITVPLTKADQDFIYTIRYGNSEWYTLTIDWNNTDNVVATPWNEAVPTMTVVGVAGAHKDNFRAEFTKQAKWEKDDNGNWMYKPAVLQFNIAAMTKNDRATIAAAANNKMTIKVKALDKNGYPYPQGTMVTFQNVADQEVILGSSDKFVTVKNEVSYLVDNMGCFNMTFSGIKNFAAVAAYGTVGGQLGNTFWDSTDADDIETGKTWMSNNDKGDVYLYSLVSKGFNEVNGANTQATAAKKIVGDLVVRFAYGNTAEEVGFNLKYQNTARTKSGITLLTDVITVKVGEQTGIPYIIDDPMAMYQGIKGTWKYVNEGIAKAGKDTNGDTDSAVVLGVKVGTTYAYVEDQDGDIELVVINVLPADYVETPVVEEVEVGTKYVVTASRLNVREGAGTSYSRIRQIDRNTVVTGTEVEGSVWVKLNDGGYVHGKYLAEVE